MWKYCAIGELAIAGNSQGENCSDTSTIVSGLSPLDSLSFAHLDNRRVPRQSSDYADQSADEHLLERVIAEADARKAHEHGEQRGASNGERLFELAVVRAHPGPVSGQVRIEHHTARTRLAAYRLHVYAMT